MRQPGVEYSIEMLMMAEREDRGRKAQDEDGARRRMRVRTVTVVPGIRSIYRPIRNLLCNVAPRRYAAIVVHNLEYLGESITVTVHCKNVSLEFEHRRFECLFIVAFNSTSHNTELYSQYLDYSIFNITLLLYCIKLYTILSSFLCSEPALRNVQ